MTKHFTVPEYRYRDLVESLDAIVWEADPRTFQFTFVSQSAVSMLGYPVEQWINEPGFWANHLHPDDRDRSVTLCLDATREGRDHRLEYRAVAQDGRTVWLRDIVRVIKDDDGEVTQLRGVMVDITEQRDLEGRLRQSQKMEAVGLLAGGVAHDFNNLLTVILGQCELLGKRSTDDCPLRQEVREIFKAADQAHRLTGQLLAFGRRQVLEPRVLHLQAGIEKIGEALRRLAGPGLDLEIQLDPRPVPVKIDPGQLEQVLQTLVADARDSLYSGGKITIVASHLELTASRALDSFCLPPGRYATLSVSDNGPGISRETLARIFEPFFTTNTLGRGSGLGLATVYGIVKQSGGHILAVSTPGDGTTFKIFLPEVDHQPEPLLPVRTAPQPAYGKETLLLVEDHQSVRNTVRDFLQSKGYQVLTADGAEEAHQLSAGHTGPIHLLITDVVMPTTSGPELACQLTAIRPATKVLFISGYPDYAVQFPSALAEGAVLLQKPFRLEALARKVREVLGT